MISRADVSALGTATSRISEAAQGALEAFFKSADLSDPVGVRNALLEVVPALSDTYGNLASLEAAEWYEAVRNKSAGGTFYSQLGDLEETVRVQQSVRWAAGELWTDHPFGALDLLKGALQRQVTFAGRSTVLKNAQIDPAKPRWAHVPSGANTCAWCTAMAGRGWVYRSKETAELHSEFHDNCKCQVVPSWDHRRARIAGYNPERDYALYKAARVAGEPLSKTVRRMEKQNPELFGPKD